MAQAEREISEACAALGIATPNGYNLPLLTRYYKGCMQGLFSRELRFKDNEKNQFPEWEKRSLRDLFVEVREKVGDRPLDTYSITAGVGFVSQKEKFGKDISGNQNPNYTALKPGQFSYNKGNSKTYKYGCIYLNNAGFEISVPNVFISFRLRSEKNCAEYFAKLFESHALDRGLRRIISSGARMDGLLNVNKEYFFDLEILVPHPKEQVKIANFLTAMSNKIALLSEESNGSIK